MLGEVNFVFKKCIFFSTLLMLTAFDLLIMTSSIFVFNDNSHFFLPFLTDLRIS
jgi:hypothetical protein